jgi:hypothetical protein
MEPDDRIVSGEVKYFFPVFVQNMTMVFPFEKISTTLSEAGLSYTATGTAFVMEMPTMTSGYTFTLNVENKTYELRLDSPTWQSFTDKHPIVGHAIISSIENYPNVQKGDSSPLTRFFLKGLNIILRKNGTFGLYDGVNRILSSLGDPTFNGGVSWRHAQITPSLPLSGKMQGGFLGHENFSVESSTESPLKSAIKVVDLTRTEKNIHLTLSETQGMTNCSLIIEAVDEFDTPVVKVTINAPDDANHVSCSFGSDSDERFYGFGSPTWTSQHRGNSIPVWVTEQLLGRITEENPSNYLELKGHPYDNQIPIPFFMSSNGYGILLDTTYRSLFEMCTDDHPDSWRLETWNNETSFYIFTGNTFIDLIKTYTLISGRPEMPPQGYQSGLGIHYAS